MSRKDGKGPHGVVSSEHVAMETRRRAGRDGVKERRAVCMICSHVVGTAYADTVLPGVDSNHRSPKTADLQSAAFDLFAIPGIQETASLLHYER